MGTPPKVVAPAKPAATTPVAAAPKPKIKEPIPTLAANSPLVPPTGGQIKEHDVLIKPQADPSQTYPFLVHCNTCGWQGRCHTREQAVSMRQNHINARVAQAIAQRPRQGTL